MLREKSATAGRIQAIREEHFMANGPFGVLEDQKVLLGL
jgi:hypothetical protein